MSIGGTSKCRAYASVGSRGDMACNTAGRMLPATQIEGTQRQNSGPASVPSSRICSAHGVSNAQCPSRTSEAMNQLFRDAFTWPRLFDVGTAPGSRPGFGVTYNLYEKDDSYIMQVLLPGVKVDDLQITAHQNVLTLQGIAGVAAPEGARHLGQPRRWRVQQTGHLAG